MRGRSVPEKLAGPIGDKGQRPARQHTPKRKKKGEHLSCSSSRYFIYRNKNQENRMWKAKHWEETLFPNEKLTLNPNPQKRKASPGHDDIHHVEDKYIHILTPSLLISSEKMTSSYSTEELCNT